MSIASVSCSGGVVRRKKGKDLKSQVDRLENRSFCASTSSAWLLLAPTRDGRHRRYYEISNLEPNEGSHPLQSFAERHAFVAFISKVTGLVILSILWSRQLPYVVDANRVDHQSRTRCQGSVNETPQHVPRMLLDWRDRCGWRRHIHA